VTNKNDESKRTTNRTTAQIKIHNRFSQLDVDELVQQGGIDIPYIHPKKIEEAKKQRQERVRQQRDRTQANREEALNKQMRNAQRNQKNKDYLVRQHNNIQYRINKITQQKDEINYKQLPTQELPHEEATHYRIHRSEISKLVH
jgi:predicted DNA-binding helix-hairpin-helix protein